MKKLLILVTLLILIAGVYWYKFRFKKNYYKEDNMQESLHVGKHSAEFNNKIDSIMSFYFDMKTAFVEADTAKAKTSCRNFISLIDSLKLDELKKDTASIYETAEASLTNVKPNAESLLMQTDITEMRRDFSTVSENLYPFLKTIHYEGKTIYWDNCPMAFGEDREANWLSNSYEIINPYLGKNHPVHKDKMLHCGEVKDSIK